MHDSRVGKPESLIPGIHAAVLNGARHAFVAALRVPLLPVYLQYYPSDHLHSTSRRLSGLGLLVFVFVPASTNSTSSVFVSVPSRPPAYVPVRVSASAQGCEFTPYFAASCSSPLPAPLEGKERVCPTRLVARKSFSPVILWSWKNCFLAGDTRIASEGEGGFRVCSYVYVDISWNLTYSQGAYPRTCTSAQLRAMQARHTDLRARSSLHLFHPNQPSSWFPPIGFDPESDTPHSLRANTVGMPGFPPLFTCLPVFAYLSVDILPVNIPPLFSLLLSFLFGITTIMENKESLLAQRFGFLGCCGWSSPPYTPASILLKRSLVRPLVRGESKFIITVRALVLTCIGIGAPSFGIYVAVIRPSAATISTTIVANPAFDIGPPGNATVSVVPAYYVVTPQRVRSWVVTVTALNASWWESTNGTIVQVEFGIVDTFIGAHGAFVSLGWEPSVNVSTEAVSAKVCWIVGVVPVKEQSETTIECPNSRREGTITDARPSDGSDIQTISVSIVVPSDETPLSLSLGCTSGQCQNPPGLGIIPLVPGFTLLVLYTSESFALQQNTSVGGNMASLVLNQLSGRPIRFSQDTADTSFLSGSATFGGFWTFVNGTFGLLFGANIVYFAFGAYGGSALAFIHHTDRWQATLGIGRGALVLATRPRSEVTEGGPPGSENAGIVAFIRERLVDLGEDPRDIEQQPHRKRSLKDGKLRKLLPWKKRAQHFNSRVRNTRASTQQSEDSEALYAAVSSTREAPQLTAELQDSVTNHSEAPEPRSGRGYILDEIPLLNTVTAGTSEFFLRDPSSCALFDPNRAEGADHADSVIAALYVEQFLCSLESTEHNTITTRQGDSRAAERRQTESARLNLRRRGGTRCASGGVLIFPSASSSSGLPKSTHDSVPLSRLRRPIAA
ncbi:hypothetical protein C8R45DRAFT_938695 [Mycena sanguinolenta]|nr:hypothetical protein C8R45DRAFT_938695 [Mycena sanguinolenta]